MLRISHAILRIIGCSTKRDLLAQIDYLRAENRILRSRVPGRIVVTHAERARLVKLGESVSSGLKHIISIVTPQTFTRWVNREQRQQRTRDPQPGRPRTADDILELVLEMREQNRWGAGRIHGELKKLGITVACTTIRNILREHGYDPREARIPDRRRGEISCGCTMRPCGHATSSPSGS